MRVFHGFDDLPQFQRPVATIGTFDGVHAGHRALLGRVVERARAIAGQSIVITFDRHPRGEERLLTTLDEKIALIEALGIDHLIVIPFTEAIKGLTARDFVCDYLIARLGVQELVVGFDHRLGSDRSNDFEGLGLHIERVARQGEASSSRIRELLEAGKTEEAAQLLGRDS